MGGEGWPNVGDPIEKGKGVWEVGVEKRFYWMKGLVEKFGVWWGEKLCWCSKVEEDRIWPPNGEVVIWIVPSKAMWNVGEVVAKIVGENTCAGADEMMASLSIMEAKTPWRASFLASMVDWSCSWRFSWRACKFSISTTKAKIASSRSLFVLFGIV